MNYWDFGMDRWFFLIYAITDEISKENNDHKQSSDHFSYLGSFLNIMEYNCTIS